MANNTKTEGNKSQTDKQSEAGAGKVSAGTSVGNIGEAPMPHAHDEKKSAQNSTLASHTSQPMGGNQSDHSKAHSSQHRSSQDDKSPVTEKVQEVAQDMRHRAEEVYEGASDWARDTYERASDWASDAYEGQRRRVHHTGGRSAKAFGKARGGVQSYASENPMVVGIVGLAAGLLLGALIPRTRRENEVFGEWADEVRNQGVRYARDAASRGREFVDEAFTGEDTRFSRHETEFDSKQDANRH